MLMINGFLILDNENREYSAYSGELCPARSDWQLQITLPGGWRVRAPRHHTSFSEHISPSHGLRIVPLSSQQCCHADCHPRTLSLSPSLPHSLTLQCVSLLASRAALGRGSHQAAARSCPNSAQTAGPDLQRSAVSHADMQQHAAADCMHNQPPP